MSLKFENYSTCPTVVIHSPNRWLSFREKGFVHFSDTQFIIAMMGNGDLGNVGFGNRGWIEKAFVMNEERPSRMQKLWKWASKGSKSTKFTMPAIKRLRQKMSQLTD